MKKNVMMLCALLPLLGCTQIEKQRYQYIRNHSKDYRLSFAVAPLEVPPGYAQPVPIEHYPLPDCLPPLGSLEKVSLAPPGFGVRGESDES